MHREVKRSTEVFMWVADQPRGLVVRASDY